MIRAMSPFAPPAVPARTGNFRGDFHILDSFIRERFTAYLFNFLNQFVSIFNNGPQGEGAPIASAAIISPTSFIHHITGSTPISTIQVPIGYPFAGILCLVSDNGVTLSTGGNIATSVTLTAGQMAILAFSQSSKYWHISV